jgi:hypothetical protein
MPITPQKFNAFSENIAEKVHKLDTDVLKLMLTNTAPVATNTIKSDITEIGAGNGYTAGGTALNVTASAQSSGTYKLVADDVTFTASGGSIGPFRYAVLYNDTQTSPAKPLIYWIDYGSSLTLNDGDSIVFDLDQAGGLLTIT